ncbi:MAG: hypothetical protein AB7O56_03105 [Bauldia sp.]
MTNTTVAELYRKLDLVRRRARLHDAVASIAIGLVVGLGVAVFLEAARRIAPGAAAGFLGDAIVDPLVVTLGIGLAAGFAAAMVAAIARRTGRPSRVAAAREIDRRLRLAERMTTATELSALDRPLNPVETVALADAGARVASIDHRAAHPWRWPAALPVAAGLLVVAAVLQLSPVGTAGAGASPSATMAAATAPPTTPTEEARTEAANLVRTAGELLRTEATVQNDAYLEAVGRTAERLAATLATADPEALPAIATELGELLDHATAAAAQRGTPAATATAEAMLADALRAVTPQRETAPQLAFVGGDGAPEILDPPAPRADDATIVPPGGERGIGDGAGQAPMDHVEGNLGGQQVMLEDDDGEDEVVNQARAGATPRPGAQPGNQGVETNLEHPELNMNAPGGMGEERTGAGTTQRGETAGEVAGNAVQAPGEEGPPPPDIEIEGDHGMMIAGDANPAGRRIRIEIPPPAELVPGGEMPPVPAGWVREVEAAVAPTALNPAARDLVAGYVNATAAIAP